MYIMPNPYQSYNAGRFCLGLGEGRRDSSLLHKNRVIAARSTDYFLVRRMRTRVTRSSSDVNVNFLSILFLGAFFVVRVQATFLTPRIYKDADFCR